MDNPANRTLVYGKLTDSVVGDEPNKRGAIINPENAAERVQRSCGNRGLT